MNIKIVRLMNSEEIIGNVTFDEDGNCTIKNGAIIVPMGEGRMAMVPWLPHADDEEVTILADKILYSFAPIKELANEYNSRLGNGLVVPQVAAGEIPGLKISGD